MTLRRYVGTELELFSRARHWKDYLASVLAPYLDGAVLEVGAGIGGTTAILSRGRRAEWFCLEPDPEMARLIAERISVGHLPPSCRAMTGTLADVPRSLRFDAILYIDVLEHVADDAEELARAAQYLEPGGVVIVVAPAYQWLFSPFDAAIGHYRRYTRGSLGAIAPPALECVALRYLDSAGLLVSMGNRLLLRRDQPAPRMIDLWDTYLVPISRVLDVMIRFTGGRSLLGIWRRGQDGGASTPDRS